jgi:2,4-dienoyl-CoA reductase-like NADH-dependent reductase (Old Yellow Enzyme family)
MSIREVETIAATTTTPLLLQPIAFRSVTLRNRIVVSPMAMYSAHDGFADDFHLVHLGRFALGGAGLVFIEATAVTEQGRITAGCNGLWHDAQISQLKRITDFLHRFGSAAGMQLAHSGWKGSTRRPGMAERGSTTRMSSCAASIRGRSFRSGVNPSTARCRARRR